MNSPKTQEITAKFVINNIFGLCNHPDFKKIEKIKIEAPDFEISSIYDSDDIIETNFSVLYDHDMLVENRILLINLYIKKIGEEDFEYLDNFTYQVKPINTCSRLGLIVKAISNDKAMITINTTTIVTTSLGLTNYPTEAHVNVFKYTDFENQNTIVCDMYLPLYKAIHKSNKKPYLILKMTRPVNETFPFLSYEFLEKLMIPYLYRHPSLMNLEGVVLNENSQFIKGLVFEYVEGMTLGQLLAAESKDMQPLTWSNTQKTIVMYGIAYGLSILHAHGIVHNDLKPDSIWIDKNLEAKIILSPYSVGWNPNTSDLTYLSPELKKSYNGEFSSDVYSLGRIFFEISASRKKSDDDKDFIYIAYNMRVILKTMLDQHEVSRPRIEETLYMFEHNYIGIFETDFIKASNYFNKMRSYTPMVLTTSRCDYVNDQAKAMFSLDDSIFSCANMAYIFGEFELASEYIFAILTYEKYNDLYTIFQALRMYKYGIAIARDDAHALGYTKLLYNVINPSLDYRFGLLDVSPEEPSLDSIYLQAQQICCGFITSQIYYTTKFYMYSKYHKYIPYLVDRLVKVLDENENAMASLGLLMQVKDNNPFQDLETSMMLVFKSSIDKYQTIAIGPVCDFCRMKKDEKGNIEYGEMGATHNFNHPIKDIAGFYADRGKYEKAYHYALKGAINGDKEAQFILGILYAEWKKHEEEAAKYIDLAAQQGESRALESSCLIYLKMKRPKELKRCLIRLASHDRTKWSEAGKSMAQLDLDKSIPFFIKASHLGDDKASELLTMYFRDGKHDLKRSMHYAKKGSDQGNKVCMHKLALLIMDTRVVKKADFQQAIVLLKKSADLGYTPANFNLGVVLANEFDKPEIGAKYLKIGADKGDMYATTQLGVLYAKGRGVPKDIKMARELIEKSMTASEDNSMALYEYGNILLEENEVEKGLYYLDKTHQLGNTDATTRLGVYYFAKQDFKMCVPYMERAYELGLGGSGQNLGVLYLNGLGVKKDWEKAELIFKPEAENGCTWCNYHLGYIYEKKDMEKSLYYYGISADGGNVKSQEWLAEHYFKDHKFEKAFHYYSLAAKQNSLPAFVALAQMYLYGIHVEQDDARAFFYFQAGALLGQPECMQNAGVMLYNGRGINKDLGLAFTLLKASAMLGNQAAQEFINTHYELDSDGKPKL